MLHRKYVRLSNLWFGFFSNTWEKTEAIFYTYGSEFISIGVLFLSLIFYKKIKIIQNVECEGKTVFIWHCCKWSEWNRCRQVSTWISHLLLYFFFHLIDLYGFDRKTSFNTSFVHRFDYIVRDTRACGLGCNFQFERHVLISYLGSDLWQIHVHVTLHS